MILMIFLINRLEQVPKPWAKSYIVGRTVILQELHVTNPTMAAVLDLWYKEYGLVILKWSSYDFERNSSVFVPVVDYIKLNSHFYPSGIYD